MEKNEHFQAIATRLQQLLDEETRLPCKFVIDRGDWAQTDWYISFYLKAVTPFNDTFAGDEIFAELSQRLNKEFPGKEIYPGIHVFVPYQFLGASYFAAAKARAVEQDKDNEIYRRVRLPENNR